MATSSRMTQRKPNRKSDRKAIGEEVEREISSYRLTPFNAKNGKQKQLFQSLKHNPLVLALGPAGTGKSFVGCYAAVTLLLENTIDKLVLTRNPIPTGHSLGFFGGTESEKLAIWLGPVIGTLKKILRSATGSDGHYDYLVRTGKIVWQPMESVKGSSFDDTFIIVEEAQECTMEQLKTLTTRVGENSTIFLNGDILQVNSKHHEPGLEEFAEAVEHENLYSEKQAIEEWDRIHIPLFLFEEHEIVRSGITRKMVSMFRKQKL